MIRQVIRNVSDAVQRTLGSTRYRAPKGTFIVKIEIVSRTLNLESDLRELIERRVKFALERFEEQIERVWIALVDINGTRGGDDKQCRVVIDLAPSGSVHIDHVSNTMESAASKAIERASHSVARTVERRHRVNEMRVAIRHQRDTPESEANKPE
jgi:putative sigma-54 modulation protein